MVWEALPYYDTANSFLDDKVNYHTLAWIDMESTATIDVAFPANPDYGQTLTTRQMEATAAMGTTWGLIATGDTMSDVMPSLSNLAATNTIAYVESDFTPDGHPDYTATHGQHSHGPVQQPRGRHLGSRWRERPIPATSTTTRRTPPTTSSSPSPRRRCPARALRTVRTTTASAR